MKIPGAERAIVAAAKVRDYLLSSEHRVGSAKARFFAQLGFERRNWTILQDELYRFATRGRVDRSQRGGFSTIRDSLSRSDVMTTLFHELDTVVLLRDLPEAGLRSGDLGAVVQVYGVEALEVEFVTASGRTQALLTLPVTDVRPVRDNDLLAVRTAPPVQGAA